MIRFLHVPLHTITAPLAYPVTRSNSQTLKLTVQKSKKIHQVTTMLATSKNVLFPGHNHLLTTGADDLTLWLSPKHQQEKGHVLVVSRWLWPGNRTFLEVASMVVSWCIAAFVPWDCIGLLWPTIQNVWVLCDYNHIEEICQKMTPAVHTERK